MNHPALVVGRPLAESCVSKAPTMPMPATVLAGAPVILEAEMMGAWVAAPVEPVGGRVADMVRNSLGITLFRRLGVGVAANQGGD